MKNIRRLFVVALALLLVIPFGVNAKKKVEYNTLNLREALAVEEIDESFKNYEENDDQAIIYLFRRDGCYYCGQFLSFLNSIADEYGKYFKLISYEVSTDQNNSELFNDVSTYLDGKAATGVPYIVIGEKVFSGYSSELDEQLKKAIKDLYDTDKKDRYDIIKKMQDKPNYDGVVAVVSIIIIAGLITVTVITRKANKEN